MPISHAIVHYLHRPSEAAATAQLRERELDTEAAEPLFSRLKAGFLARISREHGSFASDALLPSLLLQFLDGKQEFVQFTHDFTTTLQEQLDSNKIEFDAHLLFFVEKSFDQHQFMLFVARHSESLTIDPSLGVATSHAIDTGPSLFGIKVDINEWRTQRNYACLSLLPPRGNPPLAERFYELTGFCNGIDKEAATLAFLEGVEAYAKALPQEQQKGYRDQVVEYCIAQEQQDEPLRLQGLAQSVDGVNTEEFVRVLAQHTGGEEQPPEVMLDRRSLRRYVKFAGRERDLAISFSSYQLDERVRYDADNDTLVITGLPTALRKQLLGHIKGE